MDGPAAVAVGKAAPKVVTLAQFLPSMAVEAAVHLEWWRGSLPWGGGSSDECTHSVVHYTQMKSKRRGCDELDIAALLTVSDDEFREGVSPVELGSLPVQLHSRMRLLLFAIP